jgi:hypothetical protein
MHPRQQPRPCPVAPPPPPASRGTISGAPVYARTRPARTGERVEFEFHLWPGGREARRRGAWRVVCRRAPFAYEREEAACGARVGTRRPRSRAARRAA